MSDTKVSADDAVMGAEATTVTTAAVVAAPTAADTTPAADTSKVPEEKVVGPPHMQPARTKGPSRFFACKTAAALRAATAALVDTLYKNNFTTRVKPLLIVSAEGKEPTTVIHRFHAPQAITFADEHLRVMVRVEVEAVMAGTNDVREHPLAPFLRLLADRGVVKIVHDGRGLFDCIATRRDVFDGVTMGPIVDLTLALLYTGYEDRCQARSSRGVYKLASLAAAVRFCNAPFPLPDIPVHEDDVASIAAAPAVKTALDDLHATAVVALFLLHPDAILRMTLPAVVGFERAHYNGGGRGRNRHSKRNMTVSALAELAAASDRLVRCFAGFSIGGPAGEALLSTLAARGGHAAFLPPNVLTAFDPNCEIQLQCGACSLPYSIPKKLRSAKMTVQPKGPGEPLGLCPNCTERFLPSEHQKKDTNEGGDGEAHSRIPCPFGPTCLRHALRFHNLETATYCRCPFFHPKEEASKAPSAATQHVDPNASPSAGTQRPALPRPTLDRALLNGKQSAPHKMPCPHFFYGGGCPFYPHCEFSHASVPVYCPIPVPATKASAVSTSRTGSPASDKTKKVKRTKKAGPAHETSPTAATQESTAEPQHPPQEQSQKNGKSGDVEASPEAATGITTQKGARRTHRGARGGRQQNTDDPAASIRRRRKPKIKACVYTHVMNLLANGGKVPEASDAETKREE